jgi:hypothetical protein
LAPHTEELQSNIVNWITENLLDNPDFMEFKKKQMELVLSGDFSEELDDFILPKTVAKQHALIMSFYDLYSAQRTLSQYEFYFGHFPFKGIKISRDEHLRNICKFYFFYVLYNTVAHQKYSYDLNPVCENSRFDVSGFLKHFDKEFDYELRARNRVQHHENFADPQLRTISVTEILSSSEELKFLGWRYRNSYRTFSKRWSRRARQRALMVQEYVEMGCALDKLDRVCKD